MKVILISPGWPAKAFANGIASYIGNLREGLSALGIDSWVFAHSVAVGEEIDDQITDLRSTDKSRFIRLFSVIGNRLRGKSNDVPWTLALCNRLAESMLVALNRLPASFEPNLIEMDDAFGCAAIVAAKTKIPIVVRLHGPYFLTGPAMGAPQDNAFQLRLDLEREAILGATGLTAPSLNLLERVREEYGVGLDHAVVIPNPAPSVASEDMWIPERADKDLILFVGRFDRHKGGDLAIQAFAQLAQQRTSLRLVFVGPDRNYITNDGRPLSLENFLEETINDRSILARIEIHDQLKSAEITPLRKKAALTLVASRWENFPMTVLEALAHGCPLVAPATGGITEIVTHEENGLLFKPENISAMTKNLADLLDAPELAARCGKAGAQTIQNKFSIEVVARQTQAYYESLLGRGS